MFLLVYTFPNHLGAQRKCAKVVAVATTKDKGLELVDELEKAPEFQGPGRAMFLMPVSVDALAREDEYLKGILFNETGAEAI